MSTSGEPTTTASAQFLSNIIGQSVVVKLHNGMMYQGVLESIDGFMNIALNQATEHYETASNGLLHRYDGDVFVRGTQVLYISEA
ncbi:LAQU0S04e01816g1_1 [Lachancea quebecensis]|uniref:LAQU0S04e01816g1_1 n=1 Tax=Lachancea quebecensis TaxID=1654605 RepID=A0A0P1KPV5_9SACH|nr:LAQU0S04e01816g1_1 [Lachancea quebecensis]